MTFAPTCRGALVAMPCVDVHADTRVSAYVSRVVRAGAPAGRTVRVALYRAGRLAGLYVRGARGWYA